MGFQFFNEKRIGRLVPRDIERAISIHQESTGTGYIPPLVASAQREPCPPGTQEVYLGMKTFEDETGHVFRRQMWGCETLLPFDEPYPTGGEFIRPYTPVEFHGGGFGGRKKQEDPQDKEPDEFVVDQETQQLIDNFELQLKFGRCCNYAKTIGTKDCDNSCCCTPEEKKKIAKLLYMFLAKNEMLNHFPWVKDCLKQKILSLEICCKQQLDDSTEWMDAPIQDKLLAIKGRIKLTVNAQRFLVTPLLGSCGREGIDWLQYDTPIFFNSISDQSLWCIDINALKECQKKGTIRWRYTRYFAIDLCTGNTYRIKDNEVDLEYGPMTKLAIPSYRSCERILNKDQGFEYYDHDKGYS